MTSFRYSVDWLRERRKTVCMRLPRRLRRYLFILGLFVPGTPCDSTKAIPVRITRRRHPSSRSLSKTRCIKNVKFQQQNRPPRNPSSHVPSLLLANIRSLNNKFEEWELLLSQRHPDLAFLTETWLDDTVSEAAISVPGYGIVRRDRPTGRGGGIMCYFRDSFSVSVLSEADIPSLRSVTSELLCVYIRDLGLVAIIIYHPYWNNVSVNQDAIDCIVEVLDFALIK